MKVTVQNNKVNLFLKELEVLMNDDIVLKITERDFWTTITLDLCEDEDEQECIHVDLLLEEIQSL